MSVMISIVIMAVIATPTTGEKMRERRARQAEQEIALIYGTARMRAMGRGAAVLVRYQAMVSANAALGFHVLESIQGKSAEGVCQNMPGTGCLSTNWQDKDSYRDVGSFMPAIRGEYSDVTAKLADPAGTTQSYYDVCFTPLGRAYAISAPAPFTQAMTGAAVVTVQRGSLGVAR